MPLKDTWKDLIQDESFLNADDINKVAHAVIDVEETALNNEKRFDNYYTSEKIDTMVLKPVDLTTVARITRFSGIITEDSIKQTSADSPEGIIDVSGYVAIEVENNSDGGVVLTINGERYEAFGNGEKISYSGMVQEPIVFELYGSAIARFTKFVSAVDYDLYKKFKEETYTEEEKDSIYFEDVDLTEYVTVDAGEMEVTKDSIKCTVAAEGELYAMGTINVLGYVEIEAKASYDVYQLNINGRPYNNEAFAFKGFVTQPIIFSVNQNSTMTFDRFVIPFKNVAKSKLDEVDGKIQETSEKIQEVSERDLRTVDLTKCMTVTGGNGEFVITSNSFNYNNATNTGKFLINVTGYVEIEVTGETASSLDRIKINGTYYKLGDGSSFKGVVNEPIEGTVGKTFPGATFTRFVTTSDYELLNKVGDIDTALEAIITEQEAIIAMQNSLIGGDA